MSVPPLTRHDDLGNLYKRTDEVQSLLLSMSDLSFDEIVRRCGITSRKNTEYIPSECLIHFMRRTRGDNGDARFNRLFALVLRRFLQAFPRGETRVGDDIAVDGKLNDISDYAKNRFLVLLTKDKQGGDQLDFYEVHFDEAVALLRLTADKRVGRWANKEVSLELDPETNEPSPAVEEATANMHPGRDAFLFDERFRSQILVAIDTLPPEQKVVMKMLLNNFQIESNDPAVPAISRLLKCDPRTVQYRRTKAVLTIRKTLGLGDSE